jgi:hypothetical protein
VGVRGGKVAEALGQVLEVLAYGGPDLFLVREVVCAGGAAAAARAIIMKKERMKYFAGPAIEYLPSRA